MSLAQKLAKTGAKGVQSIVGEKSQWLADETETIPTQLPVLNIALSGEVKGGISPGVTIFAGESATGKTILSWLCAKAFQKKHDDGVVVFYDSEFGTTNEYLDSIGIDLSRVIHVPVTDIEELNFDIMAKLNAIEDGENVFILVDSLGNIASKKEVEDALAEKSAQDMTRAKKMKALFRQITPIIAKKKLYFVGIAHTYNTQELYSKQILSGGTGLYYSANNIIMTSKAKLREGTEVIGTKINLKVEKSRFVKPDSKFSAELTDKGFNVFSGITELAIEAGLIKEAGKGWYYPVDIDTGVVDESRKVRLKEIATKENLIKIMKSDKFNQYVARKYKLAGENAPLIDEDVVNEE